MDELVRIALVGTSKHAAAGAPDAEHPAEAIVGKLKETDREAVFLLRAGARALFEQCGQLAASGVSPPEPSPADARAFASGKVVSLLRNAMAVDSHDLLVEFLGHMESVELLLPPEILPQALGVTDAAVRERLLPLLGERGRWLSRFNPDWRWATAGPTDLSDRGRESLLHLWDEGDIRQRCAALRALRRSDATEARGWIEGAIDKEKPDNRVLLLKTLEIGLSEEDEPLLESRLDDRSEQVRATASGLLARLPAGALARRMRERAEAILSPKTAGWIRKRLRVACHPPEEIDKSWTRDGIPAKAPPGRGKRAVWTEVVLAAVPPSIWSEEFHADPSQLIAAVAEDDFAAAVLSGWTRAAAALTGIDKATAAWLRPLWDHWTSAAGKGKKKQTEAVEHLELLLCAMPGDEAEAALLPLVDRAESNDEIDVFGLFEDLRRPWSPPFAERYLAAVRAVLKRRGDNRALQWAYTLTIAALALPREVFPAALTPWEAADAKRDQWHSQAVGREIEKFIETIHTRQSFYEEAVRRL